jgi:signal transduction histidine kinase
MELYRQKSWWKILLVIIGMIILGFTMVFTNYLSNRMAENERKYMEFYNKALNSILVEMKDTSFQGDFSGKQKDFSLELFITENVKNKIILDDGTNILSGFNWGENKDTNQVFLLEQLLKIKESGVKPFLPPIDTSLNIDEENIYPKIYYKYNDLYILITWFPLIQVALVALFIFFGYTIFGSIKKSEQNRVWAGMAKETAHQLGTPISGIIGWTEYLKNMTLLSEDQYDAVTELENDVKKLDLIADRFSKIGSIPVLEIKHINDVLSESVAYIKKRSPKNIVYIFDETANPEIEANINDHLFSWVIENILRNALDSMGDKGTIKINTSKTPKYVIIDLTDSGKGIPSGKFKTVFKPGFSTKKRGWGLGLSLAKRIIEDYHKGKIFVLKSKINEGTTFRIMLPIVKLKKS